MLRLFWRGYCPSSHYWWVTFCKMSCMSCPSLPPLYVDLHGSSLCLGVFVSDSIAMHCTAITLWREHLCFLSCSYLLSPWLPAYEFSHLILFLVGLWALLDKESLVAIVSVSTLALLTSHLYWLRLYLIPYAVHCGVGIHHLTGYYSVGAVLSWSTGCKWQWKE